MCDIKELIGKTIGSIDGLHQYSDQVVITTEGGETYRFYHEQDCCEEVSLEDFEVDSHDLSGGYITSAVEVSNYVDMPKCEAESYTWTFYKIETTKGGLWMRWLGESNGYYSESVDFERVN